MIRNFIYEANLFLLILILGGLVGCTDTDQIDVNVADNNQVLDLHIMGAGVENIRTRGGANPECYIGNILAVVVGKDGDLRMEDCSVGQITNNGTSSQKLTLKAIHPAKDEKLYLFCNTQYTKSVITATTEEALLKEVLTDRTVDKESLLIPMYGFNTVGEGLLTVDLIRSFAKGKLVLDENLQNNKYAIKQWGISNIPSQGYAANGQGIPAGTLLTDSLLLAEGEYAYFNERSDNDVVKSGKANLYVLLEQNKVPLGWYRLDFYKNNAYMAIHRNTDYQFNITAVNSHGYLTLKEALENPGSNIEYNVDISDTDWGDSFNSNGQYLLQTNKDEIIYSTSQLNTTINDVLVTQAKLLSGATKISTYTAQIREGKNLIKLVYNGAEGDSISLLSNGNLVEDKEISLKISGNVLPAKCYIELRLGNIVKNIPIRLISANSYLVNFNNGIGKEMKIPLIQANLDGITRIKEDDKIIPIILWSDVSSSQLLNMRYSPEEQCIVVENEINFIGNVVVAVTVGGVIKWSWHLWSLDENDLTSNTELAGILDLKHTYKQNGLLWMDRNLGALTTRHELSARGLLYQYGRKDPFPPSDAWMSDGVGYTTFQTIYKDGGGQTAVKTEYNLSASTVNLENSIENPMTIYLSNSYGIGDWYADKNALQNNNLWVSKENRGKTPYDPCPAGWRVPVAVEGSLGPWVGLYAAYMSKDNTGFVWQNDGVEVYFPTVCSYVAENAVNTFQYFKDYITYTTLWWAGANESGDGLSTFGFMQYSLGITSESYVFSGVRSLATAVRCVKDDE